MSLRLARVFAARILPLHHHGFATSMPKISPIRGLHGTRVASYPRKGSQDKDSIDREPNEYSKSGTDEETAEQEQAAFDPNITDPHKEQSKAGEGKKGNPLDYSPANPDVSKPRGDGEGGPEHAPGEQRLGSGGGSGAKNKSTG